MFIFTPSVSISKLDSHSMGVSFPWDSHGIPIPCRALRCKTGPVFDWLVPATDRVRLTASKRAVLRRRMRDSTTVSPNSSFFNSHKSGCNKTVLFITLHPRVIFRHRNRKKNNNKTTQPNPTDPMDWPSRCPYLIPVIQYFTMMVSDHCKH